MIAAVSWVPKGASKAVPDEAQLPSKEEIEEMIKSGTLEEESVSSPVVYPWNFMDRDSLSTLLRTLMMRLEKQSPEMNRLEVIVKKGIYLKVSQWKEMLNIFFTVIDKGERNEDFLIYCPNTMKIIKVRLNQEEPPSDMEVKLWVDEVKQLAGDVEGMLDEIAKSPAITGKKNLIEHLTPACVGDSNNSGATTFADSLSSGVRGISSRIEKLNTKRVALGLTVAFRCVFQRSSDVCSVSSPVETIDRDSLSKMLRTSIMRLEKLSPEMKRLEVIAERGIYLKVCEWNIMLNIFCEVINEREEQELKSNMNVKLWVDEVNQLAGDVEGMLDEIAKSPTSGATTFVDILSSRLIRTGSRMEKLNTKRIALGLTANPGLAPLIDVCSVSSSVAFIDQDSLSTMLRTLMMRLEKRSPEMKRLEVIAKRGIYLKVCEWHVMLNILWEVINEREEEELKSNMKVKLWVDEVSQLAGHVEWMLDVIAKSPTSGATTFVDILSSRVIGTGNQMEKLNTKRIALGLTANPGLAPLTGPLETSSGFSGSAPYNTK